MEGLFLELITGEQVISLAVKFDKGCRGGSYRSEGEPCGQTGAPVLITLANHPGGEASINDER